MDDNGMEKAFQEFKNNKLCHYSKENIDYFIMIKALAKSTHFQ